MDSSKGYAYQIPWKKRQIYTQIITKDWSAHAYTSSHMLGFSPTAVHAEFVVGNLHCDRFSCISVLLSQHHSMSIPNSSIAPLQRYTAAGTGITSHTTHCTWLGSER
jgi:hypothetical protein